jgi:transcriptional regulator PpsR
MESLLSSESPGRFRAPDALLGDLDAETAADLIAAAAEVALIVSPDGVIRDVAFNAEDLAHENFESWIGRPWADTVTAESRPKVEELLKEARSRAGHRWRQVNHSSRRGPDIPIRYRAILAGNQDNIVAIGRDLRAMATLQQRLVEAQLGMEREYNRLRSAETRYRLLFHVTTEAVLILDADTLKVVEANPAAAGVLGKGFGRAVGRRVLDLFQPAALKPCRRWSPGLGLWAARSRRRPAWPSPGLPL